jgi:hypothetical protein
LTHDWFAAVPIDRDRLWRNALIRVVPLLLALCVPRAALADPMTFDYSGTLSEIFPLGSVTIDDEFVLGEAVNLSVTWDPDIPEAPGTLADPNRGVYENALDSFSIGFPDNLDLTTPFEVVSGGLNFIDVINDLFATVDQVLLAGQASVGDTLTGTLDGATPTLMTLTFSDFDMMGGIPVMLVDDSLPDMALDAASVLVTISLTPGISVSLTFTELTVPEPSLATGLIAGFTCLASAARRKAKLRA